MKYTKSKETLLLALLPCWNPLLPPQGIARIKAYLQKHGYPVKTIDANLDNQFKKLYDKYFDILKSCIPREKWGNIYNIGNDVWREHMMAHLNYTNEEQYCRLVKKLIASVFYWEVEEIVITRLNTHLTQFYTYLEAYWTEMLAKVNPGVLGISVYRDTLPASLFAFRLTRKKYPQIRTLMGGGIFTIQLPVGSPNLEFFLEKTRGEIDKVFIGSGEQMLLEYLEGKLPDEKRVYTLQDLAGPAPDVTTAELPDLSDFDYRNYYYLAAQASSSCPNRCSFCNVASFYGEYRRKEARQIVSEMIYLHQQYKSQLFYMLDALLNPVITDLAQEFIKSGVSLYWDGYFRIDAAAANIDNVYLWRRGGFYRARIGAESGSQRILDMMGKEITTAQTKAAITNLAQAGIKTTLYIVIGHPGETEDDFQQTLDLMEELKDDIWEAECNPFTYIYSGQGKSDEWAGKRKLLYPAEAKDMLLCQTWYVECQPSREEMFRRISRFVEHCNRLGISTPWNLHDVNHSDIRWKKLHGNAVPSLLELTDKDRYIDEARHIQKFQLAQETFSAEMASEFTF